MMKGFLLDLNRCTGCHACSLACSIENDLGAETSWRAVHTFNTARRPQVPRFHLSLGCQHCEDPACLEGCPALAYARDRATGAVIVDPERCIGCRYCTWTCPYDAPRYSLKTGTVAKCTLCRDRLLSGRDPACASLCPTGALQYRELPPESTEGVIPGFPETGIRPAIGFIPIASSYSGPELSAQPPSGSYAASTAAATAGRRTGISPKKEWSLVLFTLGTALLVAIVGAAVEGTLRITPDFFFLAALSLAGISSAHLGRWSRGWRAVLNLRQSWLSREIVLFLVFAGLAAGMFWYPPYLDLLGWPAVLAGFACLYAIDQVYERISDSLWTRLHSARALLTGVFFLGLLTLNPIVTGIAGLAKLALYAHRQPWAGNRRRLPAAILRLGLGFVLPLAVWRVHPEWVLPSVLIGELIDRCEYYLDIEIQSPQAQLALDLEAFGSGFGSQPPDGNS